jgi:hypothetical protein
MRSNFGIDAIFCQHKPSAQAAIEISNLLPQKLGWSTSEKVSFDRDTTDFFLIVSWLNFELIWFKDLHGFLEAANLTCIAPKYALWSITVRRVLDLVRKYILEYFLFYLNISVFKVPSLML